MKKLLVIKILIILALGMLSTSVWAQRGRARTMVDRLIEERRSGRRVEPEQLEYHQRRFEDSVVRLLRNRSGLTSRQLNMETLREFVGRFEGETTNVDAIAEFLGNITARGNVTPAQQMASANVMAQVMRMARGREPFMIEPRDLLEMDRAWSVTEKDMLADVLLEARRITEENPSLGENNAFERALENRGLLDKFRRRCR